MGRYIITCLMILILLPSCKNESKTKGSNTKTEVLKSEYFKKDFSEGKYKFAIKYDQRLDSTFLDVAYSGQTILRDRFKGIIEHHVISDLDKNRNKEVFFVVNNGDQTGLRGISLDIRNVEHIRLVRRIENDRVLSPTYSSERNQILERYKIVAENGKERLGEVRYNMVRRNDALILLPQGWQEFELKNLLGQYILEDSNSDGLKKELLIGEREGGLWSVEIKVLQKKDGHQVCYFKGQGEFVNRDLLVPLNQADESLKGELQIRFVNALATVYTAKKEDYKEMAFFCTEEGSIIGNYKRQIYE